MHCGKCMMDCFCDGEIKNGSIEGVDVRLLEDSDKEMQLNISMKACTAVHTWPGTTALENSLFS